MTKSLIAITLVGVTLLCCTLTPAQVKTWYVSKEVGGGDFTTIQEALDAALPGDTVVVAEGTYSENINFGGKNTVLRSTLPLSSDVVANSVIEGIAGGGSVVTFSGSEGPGCMISGFTIRNGSSYYGGGICGGDNTTHNRATIENNIISGNSAWFGGGIAFCDGVIQNNLIVQNTAWFGGGLYDCDGQIQNDTVVSNSGSGFYECDNTFGVIQNCIVWGNDEVMSGGTPPIYSCLEWWVGGGTGNISSDPLLGGDFHLLEGSPCIDTGNPATSGLPLWDLDGNYRIINGVVDMGAFEFQVSVGDIEVSPTEFDFGEVEIRAWQEVAVAITNVGEADLELAGVSLIGSGDFSIISCPALPVVIAPAGAPVEIEVAYEPSSVGPVSATVRIVSNDPDEGTVEVSLTGTGIAPDLTPEEQIEDILLHLAEFVDDEVLTGAGSGKSGAGRMNAFGNMLDEAQNLILNGDFAGARQQLLDAYRRVDGLPRPPDFVSGPAAEELAGMILDLMDALAEG